MNLRISTGNRRMRCVSVAEWKRFGAQSKLSMLSAINLQNSSYKLENKISGAQNQVVLDTDAKILSFVNKFTYRYQFNEYLLFQGGLDANLYKVISGNHLPSSAQSPGYNKSRTENSLFAELEAKVNSKLSAVLLLREELIDFEHKDILPLLRLTFQPNPSKQLLISGSVAKNSHLPTLNDLYYIPGGNPNLKSEKGTLYDLGTSDSFTFGNNQIHTGISFFYSNINDWIIWLPTFQGYWEPKNIERVVSSGVESEYWMERML